MLRLYGFTLNKLADFIKEQNLSIIVYGAGMIGKIIIPDYLKRKGLQKYVRFYIDADVHKQGKYIQIGSTWYPIYSLEHLEEVKTDSIIIITNSNFLPVLNYLDSLGNLDGTKAVIFPVLQTLEADSRIEKYQICEKSSELIPKVINYCWFSGREMPEYLQKCIDSWKRYCPDYEIRRWDESNYDITKNQYMQEAYSEGKWGFVPDFARLDILYNYGGFYIDTDVELIRPLDELREELAFCGVEKWGNINMGGCSGAVAHHPMIKKLLNYRKNIHFKYSDGSLNPDTCGIYETAPFLEEGMRADNTVQRINGMTIFSSDFFHPYDYMSGQTIITENTVSIHHFNGDWLSDEARKNRFKTLEQYKAIIKRMNCSL